MASETASNPSKDPWLVKDQVVPSEEEQQSGDSGVMYRAEALCPPGATALPLSHDPTTEKYSSLTTPGGVPPTLAGVSDVVTSTQLAHDEASEKCMNTNPNSYPTYHSESDTASSLPLEQGVRQRTSVSTHHTRTFSLDQDSCD